MRLFLKHEITQKKKLIEVHAISQQQKNRDKISRVLFFVRFFVYFSKCYFKKD
jgi:hypothetical protein